MLWAPYPQRAPLRVIKITLMHNLSQCTQFIEQSEPYGNDFIFLQSLPLSKHVLLNLHLLALILDRPHSLQSL